MNHAVIPATCPSKAPELLGGSPGSSQSLSTSSQPQDQIQVLLQGSLDPLLSSDGGSLSLSLWLGRSDPSLDSERLSLGRSELGSLLSLGRLESEVDGSLSDGGSLWLAEEPATLGSSLSLGLSLSEADSESLRDRESEPLRDPECESLADVESESLSDRDSLTDSESLADPESDSLCDVDPESLSDCDALPDWLADSEMLPDPDWLCE